MMGKYCQDSVRSQSSNNRRYWSWRPCQKQPCTRTSKYGDKTCAKDGFNYLVGGLAAAHCPGAIRDTTMTNTYKSYKICERSDCKCTEEYDGIEKFRCATDGKCFLDGGSSAKDCPGAVKHPRGEFYYSREVCKFQGGTVIIGSWYLERSLSRPVGSTRTWQIKTTQKDSRSKQVSDEALNGWAKQISRSNSVEVAAEVGADFGMVTASLSSKYSHTTDKTRSSNFQSTITNLATEAFEQSVEETVTIALKPIEDPSEPTHANVWIWKVQAIAENEGEGIFAANRLHMNWVIENHGCGNDNPPNCVPGFCQSRDPNCWECTQEWAKIDPNFRFPAYCGGGCYWQAVEVTECPSPRECYRLPGCTEQMKPGELCHSNLAYLPNGDPAKIKNCHGRYSVYQYKCDF